MRSLKNSLDGRLRLSVIFEYPEGLVRPYDFSTRNAPAETSRVAQSLRFCKVSLAALQLLSQKLLFSHIHCGSEKPLENFVFENRNTHTSNIAKFAVGSNDSLLHIAAATLCVHSSYGLCHGLAVFRVNAGEILIKCRGPLLWVEAVDLK